MSSQKAIAPIIETASGSLAAPLAATVEQPRSGRPAGEGAAKSPSPAPCQHPVWTYRGDGRTTYLKCNHCPVVMPICHECGQSTMPETSEEEW